MGLRDKDWVRNRLTAFVLSLSAYFMGYTISIFNSMAGPVLRGHFHLTQDQADSLQGDLNFYYCIAAAVGVLSMNSVISKFGRMNTTKCCDLIIVALNLVWFIDSVYAVQCARIAIGFFAGLYNTSSGLILVEKMPKSHSEFGNLLICAILGIFGLISYAQQALLDFEQLTEDWRLIMIWPTMISVFRLIYLQIYVKTDTPHHVYNQYRNSDKLRAALLDSFGEVYAPGSSLDAHVDKFIALRDKESASEGKVSLWDGYRLLLSKRYFKRTVGCLVLRLMEALTGYPVLCFISTSFFGKMGLDGILISVVFGLFSVIGSLAGIYLIARFKRVSLMLTGSLVQATTLFLIWLGVHLGSQTMVVFSLAVYLMGHWSGIGGVAGLYIAETTTSLGVGLCTGLSWLTWAMVAKLCAPVTKALGESNSLICFSSVCVGIFFILSISLVGEDSTDGRDTKEIDQKLVSESTITL